MSAALTKQQMREMLHQVANWDAPQPGQPGDEWITVPAAAELLGLPVKQTAGRARRGSLDLCWFQDDDGSPHLPMLRRRQVEDLAAELQRLQRVQDWRARHNGYDAPGQPLAWYAEYEDDIESGFEECRHCGATESLRLCRVHQDRPWALANATILCAEHADDFPPRDGLFHWRRGMETLADEEREQQPRG